MHKSFFSELNMMMFNLVQMLMPCIYGCIRVFVACMLMCVAVMVISSAEVMRSVYLEGVGIYQMCVEECAVKECTFHSRFLRIEKALSLQRKN